MKLDLVFPNVNRTKSYKSEARNYAVFVNSKKIYQVNQNDSKTGSLEVELGDKVFIQKRFGRNIIDASFYYIVGDTTAELINQQKNKKHVYTNASEGVLFVLDDIDFNKAIRVAK
tara:strand:- start:933 stop:1277 length:345 start_codon:yes stop_codon:yes gene_type:complete